MVGDIDYCLESVILYLCYMTQYQYYIGHLNFVRIDFILYLLTILKFSTNKDR